MSLLGSDDIATNVDFEPPLRNVYMEDSLTYEYHALRRQGHAYGSYSYCFIEVNPAVPIMSNSTVNTDIILIETTSTNSTKPSVKEGK